jgi:SAM-dependent methyltransferase
MTLDWNAAYAKGDTPWDKGEAAPPLVEFLGTQKIAGKVLVPGSGAGHDVRLLAEQGANVLGLDLAEGALEAAQRFAALPNARYRVGDFLSLPDDLHGQFDWVVEHTCFCALEPEQRADYVRSVRRALKPDGHFLAIFFRVVAGYEGQGPPHPISTAALEAHFAEDFKTVRRYTPQLSYPCRPYGSEEVRLLQLSSPPRP